MKKNLNYLLCLMASMLIIYGCEKETISFEKTNQGGGGVPPTAISFSKDIVPIFNSKCVGCHGDGGQTPNLATNPYQSLTTGGYINTSAPASSKIYVKLSSATSSHAGRSTADDQDKILTWITQGAKNN